MMFITYLVSYLALIMQVLVVGASNLAFFFKNRSALSQKLSNGARRTQGARNRESSIHSFFFCLEKAREVLILVFSLLCVRCGTQGAVAQFTSRCQPTTPLAHYR
jgi:hypothetical protein